MQIEVLPTNAGLGAEVRGIDMRKPLSPEELEAFRAAWHRHVVLLVRDCPVNDEQLIAFSRQFGDLQFSPSTEVTEKFGEFGAVAPEITVVSNILEQGKPIGTLGSGEAFWHTDSSFIDTPAAYSILHGIELPSTGGNTEFADMYKAYDSLPDALKKRIEGLKAIHSFTHTSSGALRKGYEEITDVSKTPGAHHPLVRVHPETGRKALFLGRRLNSYIIGLPVEESEKLLDELWSYATRPELTWSHTWRPADTVMWDNRCAMHRRDAFDASQRRLLHRTQTKGTRTS
jgi:Probable taurine catabolism dioxygenase